jgi:Asp-tRNA(Asn)/Glu-tRNA(Gln) amidotransferase A subunit family amidase
MPPRSGRGDVAGLYDVFLTTYAFSITGLPMISLPAGLTRAGLPVGVQLAARRLREDSAIEAGGAYAAAAPRLFRRPTVDVARALPIPPVLPTPGMVMR